MRWSRAFIPTLREAPAEAEIPSHALLLRAGFIKKLAAGAYSYLPLGFRSLNKATMIVREEMDRAGASEVLMPAIHPEELWAEGPRLEVMKEILIRYTDRHGRKMLLGPTHEEVITDIARGGISSYRQLPVTLYQIQTKFRDEPRPRFGILRSCEFIMKDAYSFDTAWEGLDESYKAMYDAYCRIFDRCGLDYTIVEADTGVMGGSDSSEFMVPCENGEDTLVTCPCGYAANLEKASSKEPEPPAAEEPAEKEDVDTPGASTIEQVTEFLKVPAEKLLKTLIYKAGDEVVAVLVRGDHNVNEMKLGRHLGTVPEMADENTIEEVTGGPVGFSGPAGLTIRIIADRDAANLSNMITGGNRKDVHTKNVNAGRDYQIKEVADLRFVEEGDLCPKCGKPLEISKGIEIGHVFKLGTKYSDAYGATFLDVEGKEQVMIMGCYGIGVNRIIASAAECFNDEKGLVWPMAIAPYSVHIVPTNYGDDELRKVADELYDALEAKGIDVLMDDREARAGVKFNDADLIGVPLRVTIGPKGLKEGVMELKWRSKDDVEKVPLAECAGKIAELVADALTT
jgi:prolyl-tRNA synthetase